MKHCVRNKANVAMQFTCVKIIISQKQPKLTLTDCLVAKIGAVYVNVIAKTTING